MAEWVRRRLRRLKVPGSNPATVVFFLFRFFFALFLCIHQIFFMQVFCVNLRKFAKSFNERKFDA